METRTGNIKEHLDMKNPQDYIAYRYVELEMLRQTGAERSRLEKNVQDMLTCIGQKNAGQESLYV